MGIDYKEYDKIATEVFAPIYPDIAQKIVERTGIKEGLLLDLGCGGGYLGFALMQLGNFKTTFADVSQEMVDIAWQRGVENNLTGRFIECDVHNMEFHDDRFDLIVSRGSMPFWTDQRKAFQEIYRVLKPGGRAYIGCGLGNEAHRKRIFAEMERRGEKLQCMDRSHFLSLTTPEYEDLFKEIGAFYQVYESDEEGRWFLIGKEASPVA